MAVEQSQVQQVQRSGQMTAGELIDRLGQFDGPPEQFLANLLAVQCHLGPASAGAILRPQDTQVEVLGIYPPVPEGATAPVWLAQAVEWCASVLKAGVSTVRGLREADDMYGAPAKRHLVMVPLVHGGGVRGVEAFLVEAGNQEFVFACRDRLELTTSLLNLYEMRLTLQRRQGDMRRLRIAMETLAAFNEHERFTASGMSLCNELSSRFDADRVSLGILKGRYVQMRAMSHTEKFSRKMKLVQDIEAAMEECLDQDLEVVSPASEQATFVNRSATELARRHGPCTVLSLPLRRAGQVQAVLTVERPADKPFMIEEVEALRLACDLVTPRLLNLSEHDRWLGGRLAASCRKGLAAAIGPRYTWVKAAAILILGVILFAIFVKGTYRADADFVIEPVVKRVIAAPFEGKLDKVHVLPGQPVIAGQTVLGEMDLQDINTKLVTANSQYAQAEKEYALALAQNKTAEAQKAQAQMQAKLAERDRLKQQIAEARLVSPISGTVVSADISQMQSQPFSLGDALFLVAQEDALRADLFVPEDQVVDVQPGMKGELATPGYPDRKIAFIVETVSPRSEVRNNKNVFRVRATLSEPAGWLKTGMEGKARIEVREEPYAVIWTRPVINWVQMKLWW